MFILGSFALLLGLSGSRILPSPVVEVFEVFFLLFLLGILCLSSFTLDQLSTCPNTPEIIGLYFIISISLGYSIFLLFIRKMADEIDLDLFTYFNMSSDQFFWVDFDLFNDLPLSDVLLMDFYFLFLDVFGFSVFLYSQKSF